MKRLSIRTIIFALLIAAALTFAVVGRINDSDFFKDVWSQLFWLLIGVIATTFVLETVLQQDQDRHAREQDEFALRTFTTGMLEVLLQMTGAGGAHSSELIEAANIETKKFAGVTSKAAQTVMESSVIRGDVHHRHYVEIAGSIRDLGRNYIRTFTSSSQEMVRRYHELNQLASRWVYEDSVVAAFVDTTGSLPHNDPERKRREAATAEATERIRQVVRDTANSLSQIAHHAAINSGKTF